VKVNTVVPMAGALRRWLMPGGRGQEMIPSRKATATASERLVTPRAR
jgi:hypothetical protein